MAHVSLSQTPEDCRSTSLGAPGGTIPAARPFQASEFSKKTNPIDRKLPGELETRGKMPFGVTESAFEPGFESGDDLGLWFSNVQGIVAHSCGSQFLAGMFVSNRGYQNCIHD